ncbi:hypothetical protein LJR255_005155 [Pararhizobium sp. LjRoot255]|uniref:hypothetical protein n=1 Tax=Pararhizobium sp. LjRoot255 TaxID=3342298 RepID=UPI003ED0723B
MSVRSRHVLFDHYVAEITENKRLGDVLTYIKERQDKQTKPDVKTNTEKIGYN